MARPAAGSTSGQSASHTGTSGNQERGPRPGTPPSGSALGPAHREYGCGCGGRSALSNVRGGSCVVVRMVVMGNSRSSRGHRPRRRVLGFAAARQIWHQNDWPRSRCSSPLPPPFSFLSPLGDVSRATALEATFAQEDSSTGLAMRRTFTLAPGCTDSLLLSLKSLRPPWLCSTVMPNTKNGHHIVCLPVLISTNQHPNIKVRISRSVCAGEHKGPHLSLCVCRRWGSPLKRTASL